MHLTPITRSEFLYAFEAVPVYSLSKQAREDIATSLLREDEHKQENAKENFLKSLDPRGCFQSSEPQSHITLSNNKVVPVYNTYIRTREECYKLSDPLPLYSF